MPVVRQLDSPHFNHRPAGTAIDLIVLHAISLPPGEFEQEAIDAFFTGTLDTQSDPRLHDLDGVKVSAHFVVDRQGHITQFVPIGQRAWHAGSSLWQGRENCNNFSIGIEIIGDEQQPFTPAQYRETARLCRCLMRDHPELDRERITGHQDIAPGRKWDPGKQWDWQRFFRSWTHIKTLDLEYRT